MMTDNSVYKLLLLASALQHSYTLDRDFEFLKLQFNVSAILTQTFQNCALPITQMLRV